MDTCIESAERNGNLHFSPKGEFSSDTALRLTALIKQKYSGKGNIFINTAHVTEVGPQARHMFSKMLGYHDLPKEKVFLKGNKGSDICHDEGRVIEYRPKKKGGCGRCRNCKCSSKNTH